MLIVSDVDMCSCFPNVILTTLTRNCIYYKSSFETIILGFSDRNFAFIIFYIISVCNSAYFFSQNLGNYGINIGGCSKKLV